MRVKTSRHKRELLDGVVTRPGDTKCSKAVIHKVCEFIRMGSHVETACAAAGIGKNTYFLWLRQSVVRPRSVYRTFANAIVQANAEFEANAAVNISLAAKGETRALLLKDENGKQMYDKDGLPLYIKPQPRDWQADAWLLERKFKQRWAKTEYQEIKTDQQPAVQIVLPSNGREIAVVDSVSPDQDTLGLPDSPDESE